MQAKYKRNGRYQPAAGVGAKNSFLVLFPVFWSGFLRKYVAMGSECASGPEVDQGSAMGKRGGNRISGYFLVLVSMM